MEKQKKKIITFYYLTGEYLMISESILNNVSILSSRILNNMEFLAHWETESVTAEIIQLLCNKHFLLEAIVYVFMLQEHKKSSYYFLFVGNIPKQRYIWGDWGGGGIWSVYAIHPKLFSYNHFLSFQSFWLHSFYIQNHIALKRITFSLKYMCY